MPNDFTATLSIGDYADLELLHVIDDHAGESTVSLAEFLEVDTRSAGQRLSWLKRKGLVSRDLSNGWVLARQGRAILNGRGEDILALRKLTRSAARNDALRWVARREVGRNLA